MVGTAWETGWIIGRRRDNDIERDTQTDRAKGEEGKGKVVDVVGTAGRMELGRLGGIGEVRGISLVTLYALSHSTLSVLSGAISKPACGTLSLSFFSRLLNSSSLLKVIFKPWDLASSNQFAWSFFRRKVSYTHARWRRHKVRSRLRADHPLGCCSAVRVYYKACHGTRPSCRYV